MATFSNEKIELDISQVEKMEQLKEERRSALTSSGLNFQRSKEVWEKEEETFIQTLEKKELTVIVSFNH